MSFFCICSLIVFGDWLWRLIILRNCTSKTREWSILARQACFSYRSTHPMVWDPVHEGILWSKYSSRKDSLKTIADHTYFFWISTRNEIRIHRYGKEKVRSNLCLIWREKHLSDGCSRTSDVTDHDRVCSNYLLTLLEEVETWCLKSDTRRIYLKWKQIHDHLRRITRPRFIWNCNRYVIKKRKEIKVNTRKWNPILKMTRKMTIMILTVSLFIVEITKKKRREKISEPWTLKRSHKNKDSHLYCTLVYCPYNIPSPGGKSAMDKKEWLERRTFDFSAPIQLDLDY